MPIGGLRCVRKARFERPLPYQITSWKVFPNSLVGQKVIDAKANGKKKMKKSLSKDPKTLSASWDLGKKRTKVNNEIRKMGFSTHFTIIWSVLFLMEFILGKTLNLPTNEEDIYKHDEFQSLLMESEAKSEAKHLLFLICLWHESVIKLCDWFERLKSIKEAEFPKKIKEKSPDQNSRKNELLLGFFLNESLILEYIGLVQPPIT